jgi:transposase InsO family protein
MRFAFVDAEKAYYSVALLCRVMQVSRSGYYAWILRPPSQHELNDGALLERIRRVFETSRKTYGSPRVQRQLRQDGIIVGHNRVARLMRENGLVVKPRKGYRNTTQRNEEHPVAPNVLKRDFTATRPGQKWVSDVTAVSTGEGWLYVAPMIDLFNREVIGLALGANNDQQLTLKALEAAIATHGAPEGLIHHSDRGSTYTATDYRDSLKKHGIICSMSRKGDCWDNGVAENFFATLKKELVHRRQFRTRKEAALAIFEYVEVFYNRIRLHSSNGYCSPVDYRTNNAMAA